MVWDYEAPIAEGVCFWDCYFDCLPFAVPVAAGQEELQDGTSNVVMMGFLERFLGETVPGSYGRLAGFVSQDSVDLPPFLEGVFCPGVF